jgi:hypothetical protein
MSFMDAIASLGLMGTGYNETDRRISERDRAALSQKVNQRAYDEALRLDDIASGARGAMAKIPKRAAALGLDVDTVVPPDESDRWGENQTVTTKGIDSAEGTDVRGKLKAAADYLAEKGEIEQSEKYQKQLKALEAEGYNTMILGMAEGKDPKAIAGEFNRVGEKRIVNGRLDGTVYRFAYEDGTEAQYDRESVRAAAIQKGLLKKAETRIVPAGSTITTDDGKPLYTAPEKTQAPRNIDPLSPEGIEAGRKRAVAIAGTRPTTDPSVRRPGNLNQFDSQVKALATQHLTEVSEETGKPTMDRQSLVKLTALASSIGRKDPTLSPAEALQSALVEFEGERADIAAANDQAVKEAGTLTFADERQKAAWVKSRTERMVKMRRSGEAKAPTKEPGDGQAAPKAGSPATPQSEEDFKALPSGTRFVNPKDGRIYVKK